MFYFLLSINALFSLISLFLPFVQASALLISTGIILISLFYHYIISNIIKNHYDHIIIYTVSLIILSLIFHPNYLFIIYNILLSISIVFLFYVNPNADIVDVEVEIIRSKTATEYDNPVAVRSDEFLKEIKNDSVQIEEFLELIENKLKDIKSYQNQIRLTGNSQLSLSLSENFIYEEYNNLKNKELKHLKELDNLKGFLVYYINDLKNKTEENEKLIDSLKKEKKSKDDQELDYFLEENIQLEDKLKNTKKRYEDLIKENNQLRTEIKGHLNQIDREIEQETKSTRQEIKNEFEKEYIDFKFKSTFFKALSKIHPEELYEVKLVLDKLHETNDPKSFSRGKMKKNGEEFEHAEVKVKDITSRLGYSIIKNGKKKVLIMNFYKHNDSVLG